MTATLESALTAAVESLGRYKEVAVRLRPELASRPDDAGRWLAHCLDADRREKFSQSQVVYIFAHAKALGAHDGFNALAELCGYRVTAVLDPMEEIAALARRATALNAEGVTLNRELIARMQAAGLKVTE